MGGEGGRWLALTRLLPLRLPARLVASPLVWPYGALAVLLAALFWPAWVEGEFLISGGDALVIHYPWFVLWRDLLAAGEPPFWNPYIFSGLPALPTLQSGFGYPPHWLVTWLPPIRAMNWMVGLHVLMAGLTAAWCAGRLGASRSGQLLSGASFALGSAMTARLWAGHLSFVETNAWLPLATGLAVEVGRRRGVVWLALATTMMVLAGQPEVLIFGLWWLPLCAVVGAAREGDRRLLRAFVRVVVALGLGGALAAFQLLPTLALATISNRMAGMGWDFRTGASLPPWHLLTIIAPHLYGDPRASYWPGPLYEWHERVLYVGLIPLVAAFFARGRWRWLLWSVAIVSVCLSFGSYLPGYSLTLWLPGYTTFRVPPKHLLIAALALALAAGLGVERLHGRRVARWSLVGATILSVAALTAIWWLPAVAHLLAPADRLTDVMVQARLGPDGATALGWAAATLAALAVAARLPTPWAGRAVVALAVIELSLISRPNYLNPTHPSLALGGAEAIAGHERAVVIGPASPMLANQGPTLRVVQPGGYLSLFSGGYMQLVTGRLSPGVTITIGQADDPAVALLGYGVIFEQNPPRVIVFEPPPPQAWVARCAWPGGALEARAAQFPRDRCVTRATTTVRDAPAPPGPAEIKDQGSGRMTIEAEGPGWLVTRQPWYPGWSAIVDGSAAPIEILNGALVGTELAAGLHQVELRYRPAGLDVGLAVSAVSALVLAGAWWTDRRPRPHRASTSLR